MFVFLGHEGLNFLNSSWQVSTEVFVPLSPDDDIVFDSNSSDASILLQNFVVEVSLQVIISESSVEELKKIN